MSLNPKACIFYGVASRYVYEVIEIARRSNIDITAYIDNRLTALPAAEPALPLPPLTPLQALDQKLFCFPAHIPLITPGYRKQLVAELKNYGVVDFASLIDPTAIVARSIQHGDGFSVNAGVVIGANSCFGNQVLINRSVSIGHDADVDDFVSFGPACVLCGSCKIDAGVFIGAGAVICPEIHIGRNAVIGAGAVIVRNVPEGAVVAGNPGKVIKANQSGYNGVGV
jgi:sugar O-acyltransferase (sialic acid O-acetyltransferase NeuD family)